MKEVVILDGVRSGADRDRIAHAVFDHATNTESVINIEPKDMHLARIAAMNAPKQSNITRANQDAFAVKSRQRAAVAIAAG